MLFPIVTRDAGSFSFALRFRRAKNLHSGANVGVGVVGWVGGMKINVNAWGLCIGVWAEGGVGSSTLSMGAPYRGWGWSLPALWGRDIVIG